MRGIVVPAPAAGKARNRTLTGPSRERQRGLMLEHARRFRDLSRARPGRRPARIRSGAPLIYRMLSPKLADAIFWVAVAACLVAQAAILRSVALTRAGSAARRAAELLWAVAPAVALALVLAATWRTLHPRAESSATAAPAGVVTL